MSDRERDLQDWLAIFGRLVLSGFLSLPALVWLLPNIGESREEYRCQHAFAQAKQLAQWAGMPHSPDTNEAANFKTDPWGHEFRSEIMADGHKRFVSPGPNGVFESAGEAASDDIHSDMRTSPAEKYRAPKRRQLATAFTVAAAVGLTIFTLLQRRAY